MKQMIKIIILVSVIVTAFAAMAWFLAPQPQVYTIDGENIHDDEDGYVAPAHEELWHVVRAILPTELRQGFTEFHIFSDGIDGELAAIGPAEQGWMLSIDPIDYETTKGQIDTEALAASLIHEVLHKITLEEGQVHSEVPCQTVVISEGCLAADSYILLFARAFWPEYLYETAEGIVLYDEDDEDGAVSRFEERETDYVSEYAATNALEDMAESFMVYVLDKERFVDGARVQKVGFFDQYADLQRYGERIRTHMAVER